jgi:hypothetical protein
LRGPSVRAIIHEAKNRNRRRVTATGTFSVTGFVRRTSPHLLRSYCQSRAIELPASITWSARPAELRTKIIAAVHDLNPDTRRRLIREWERVSELTDEVGREAIIRAFRNCRGELLEEFRRHASA